MYGALMIDVAGTQLTPADIELLNQPEVGGIILFARNVASPQQVRQLCDAIRCLNGVNTGKPADILIGVDQEGGRVARLRQGFTPLPAMGTIGKLFDTQPQQAVALSYDCGYLMAAEVLAVGIDISFAPVLDRHGISQVIGDRSFHKHTDAIATLAAAFMRGMKAAGMATTGKHFPGHGSIAPDSHVAEAVDNRPLDEIYQQDLQPFIHTLPTLNALMPAHVIFSQVDTKPAGFSKIWLQDIAREQLGFQGVLFSDDLSMQAAQVAGDVSDRVIAALTAGCDMALVCNDRDAAIQAVQTAKHLPMPNQQRLNSMQAKIPTWQGSLEATCSQFAYWQQAKDNILQAFFNDKVSNNDVADAPHVTVLIDPTHYR